MKTIMKQALMAGLAIIAIIAFIGLTGCETGNTVAASTNPIERSIEIDKLFKKHGIVKSALTSTLTTPYGKGMVSSKLRAIYWSDSASSYSDLLVLSIRENTGSESYKKHSKNTPIIKFCVDRPEGMNTFDIIYKNDSYLRFGPAKFFKGEACPDNAVSLLKGNFFAAS